MRSVITFLRRLVGATTDECVNERSRIEDPHLREVVGLFKEMELTFESSDAGSDENVKIARLTNVIERGKWIQGLSAQYKLENWGILGSQTALYIVRALERRAETYWNRAQGIGPEHKKYCQAFVEDSEKVKVISEEWGFHKGYDSRVLYCYLEIGKFRESIDLAEERCQPKDASSDEYLVLSNCYRELPDYPKALEAATEALKRATKPRDRAYILEQRGVIYAALGQHPLSTIDIELAREIRSQT